MYTGEIFRQAERIRLNVKITDVNLSITLLSHISFTAINTRIITPIPTPKNIFCISFNAISSSIIFAIRIIAIKAGVTIPVAAANAPFCPYNL